MIHNIKSNNTKNKDKAIDKKYKDGKTDKLINILSFRQTKYRHMGKVAPPPITKKKYFTPT